MLFLTRKEGEKILIGDDIEIMVIDLNNHQVKIGIKAPKDVSIDREEVRQHKIDDPSYYDNKMSEAKKNKG